MLRTCILRSTNDCGTAGSLVVLVILIHWLRDCGTAGSLVILNFPYGPENWMGILKSLPCSWCCFVSPVLILGEFSKLFIRYAPPAATSPDIQGQIVGRAENWGERKMTAEGARRKGEGEKRALFCPPPPPPPSFSARPNFPPAPRSAPGYLRMQLPKPQ